VFDSQQNEQNYAAINMVETSFSGQSHDNIHTSASSAAESLHAMALESGLDHCLPYLGYCRLASGLNLARDPASLQNACCSHYFPNNLAASSICILHNVRFRRLQVDLIAQLQTTDAHNHRTPTGCIHGADER
jgi:hypothetical protein